MKNKPKNIPSPYKFAGTKIFRDTTALPFLSGGPLVDKTNHGKLLNSVYASALGNYYAAGGQMQPQGCSPGYYWNGKECVKSFVPVAKETPKPVVKNKKEQELLNYGKKTLPNKKSVDKSVKNIPFYGDISNAAQPDDLQENITEFVDPSGYFSWDDAYRAKAAWDKSGSTLPNANQALDMFGAVPGLGKLGKLKYLKNASAIKNSMKYVAPAFGVIPWQSILNAFDTGQDVNQDNINYAAGGMLKRADGSYSQRGLWDNIRANKGSGKKPTKEMLAQERKINREYRTGGQFPRPYSLPEDSFKQGGTNLHNSIYASSNAQYPAVYRNGGMTSKFYASNVPDNNISNKDLTYPENSYVYAQGGNLNNSNMNRYPAASRFLQKGSTASPLTNMMSLPAKTVAYEKGGKIYIKPENRGKFTASANRAGMGVQEFASHVLANKEDYSSTQVKRANFARNAAGWKHANGGHIMAAGGWPPGLKFKNPVLAVTPYYQNILAGPQTAPIFDTSISAQFGKRRGSSYPWTGTAHLGSVYNNTSGTSPLTGGLDLSFKGLPWDGDNRAFAKADISANYNPNTAFGMGAVSGPNFLLGNKGKQKGELRPGNWQANIMPYVGANFYAPTKAIANAGKFAQGEMTYDDLPPEATAGGGFLIGTKGNVEWRPRLFKHATQKAPVTFFGSYDLNFNPIEGKEEQELTDQGANWGESHSTYGQKGTLAFKGKGAATLGMRMPLDRVLKALPERRGIPAVEGGEYYEDPETAFRPDWTFASSGADIDYKGNPIEGEYSESLKDYKNRINSWGSGKLNPNFRTDFETRGELQETGYNDEGNLMWSPFQTDYNEQIIEDEDYKYGGAMNFKYGGFNNPGFNALPKNVQAKIKARAFNNGGVMPQLTEFNEGGRHEENILGGIPQGTGPDGRLNLVEEGETKLDAANYIFSDSLKLDKGIAAAFNLPKKDVGKTFAEISKKLNRPNSRRDNDTIEQNAIARDLENLMLAQEAFKQIDLQKDIEMMKTKHPELMEAMDAAMQQQSAQQQSPAPEEMAQTQGVPQGAPQPGSPEEQAMMEQQMMAQQQGGMPQGQPMSPEEMAQIPMSYGGSMFMRGGKMYNYGGRMYPNGGNMNFPYTVSGNTPAYDNRQFMSPVGMQNEPMFGSQEEAAAYMQNPANEAAIAQWRNPETGMGGQVQSNFYLNPDQPGTMVYPGASSAKQMRKDLSIANAPQFSFMPTAGAPITSGYRGGGHMYGKGGQVLRSIGAGAYGIGEGLLDTLTMGATDTITDRGYEMLSNIGGRSEEDLERDKMIRGFGNTAGAIGGAVVNPGSLGSAISEGSEGLGAGLTGIKGTNAEFDKTVNSLAQIGSMAGGLVGGGNPAGGLKGAQAGVDAAGAATQQASQMPQFAETLMKAGQNPFLQQVTGMAGSMMQRNGGNMYYDGGEMMQTPIMEESTNAWPPRKPPGQRMFYSWNQIKAGAPLLRPTPFQEELGDQPRFTLNSWDKIKRGQGIFHDKKAMFKYGQTDPNNPNVQYMEFQRNGGHMYKYGGSFEMPRQQMYMPLDNVERAGGYLFAGGGMMDPPDNLNNPIPLTDVPRININGKLYTMEEALAASASGEIQATPEEMADYFPSTNSRNNNKNYEESLEDDNTDETNIQTQDEEDLANLSFPGANNPNIITGGKGDYSDMEDLNEEILAADNMVRNAKNPKDKKNAQEYLSALKRMKTELENRNVDLTMKQTPMQAAGLAAPIAYNLGMGLFSKPTQLKAEDYLNKSKITPYKVNVDPQLNETRLAYNAAEQSIKNAAPSAGAYLTNRGNIAKMRAGSLGEILAKKENVDAQLKAQADLQNAQLEAQNRGTKFAIDDWNAKSKEAKRKYLEKAIEQMGTLSQNAQAMDVQEKYMRLLSPQYGKTFEYQTIFDQLKDYYKNKKSSKENKA